MPDVDVPRSGTDEEAFRAALGALGAADVELAVQDAPQAVAAQP